jgi:hypothetical protein
MSFDLDQELLEVENDGAVYSAAEICVLVRDLLGPVPDIVKDVLTKHKERHGVKGVRELYLKAAFSEKLVSRAKGNLNDGRELDHFPGGRVLNAGIAFEVGDELLDDGFPGSEALDEEICGVEIVDLDAPLDERPRILRAIAA